MNILMLLMIALVALIFKLSVVKSTGLSVPGLRSEFFDRYRRVPTVYQDLCTRVPSTRDKENYKWLGSVPSMREWGTGRLAMGLRTESYDVDNLKYEATLEVDRDEISDDQTGQIRMRVADLAVAAASYKDYQFTQLLYNGGSAGYVAYDGSIFFSTTHSSGDSGNQDNALTGAAATDTQPTVAEMRDALAKCIAAMMGFKDDRGMPVPFGIGGFSLVIPPAYWPIAIEAIGAAVIGATTNMIQNIARIVPLAGIAATDMFLLKTDGHIRPFIFQDREPLTFDAIEEGSEEEFKREKYLYGVRARYRLTYGEWRFAIRYRFS